MSLSILRSFFPTKTGQTIKSNRNKKTMIAFESEVLPGEIVGGRRPKIGHLFKMFEATDGQQYGYVKTLSPIFKNPISTIHYYDTTTVQSTWEIVDLSLIVPYAFTIPSLLNKDILHVCWQL